MPDDLFKNPLSPFDIRGKTAIVTGASAASDFYTGHVLYADGGYTAG